MYLFIIVTNYSDLASFPDGNTSPCTKISLNSSLSMTCWSNNDVNAVISCPISLSISKSLLIFTSGGSIPTYSADKLNAFCNFCSNYIETIASIELVSTRSNLLASADSATNFCWLKVLIPRVAICICNSFISADWASKALEAGST